MLRHVRWGLLFSLSLLIVIAYTAPYWLDLLEPLRQPEQQAAEGFRCPPSIAPNLCPLLEKLDEENPLEAEAMINVLLAEPVPAPSNEADPASMEADIDMEAVSVFTKTLVRTGQFIELDPLHRATGTANIWELVADGNITRFLRLEQGFEVGRGPDLRVYLSIAVEPQTPEEMLAQNTAVQVGALKGNTGAQNYLLSNDVDITQYRSVVIFSQEFQRIFSYAPLQQPVQ